MDSTLPRMNNSIQTPAPVTEEQPDVPVEEEYQELAETTLSQRLEVIELRLNAIEAALLRIRGAI